MRIAQKKCAFVGKKCWIVGRKFVFWGNKNGFCVWKSNVGLKKSTIELEQVDVVGRIKRILGMKFEYSIRNPVLRIV
ncbi:MAG: hypothetical protein HXX16_11110 [Bacteroidales bacterium]|nr:hypothetical protein [Bacteroidales bacterium]